MVGVAGFEPTTFRSQSGRATKLRHTPSVRHVGYMPARAVPDLFNGEDVVCVERHRPATMFPVPQST